MNQETLKLLACPYCVTRPVNASQPALRGELECEGGLEKPTALKCKQCGRQYKCTDGIPNLLIEEAVLPAQKPAQG